MVKLAIVGYGNLATSVYGPSIRLLGPEANLTAVVEPDPLRRRQAEVTFPGTPILPTLDDLIAESEIDGVLIAAPPAAHADLAVAAFDAGLAVYVEKPLAASQEEALRILEAWRRADVPGMVGFNYRLNPLIEELRSALANDECGRVVAARTTFGLAADAIPHWKETRAAGGGALLDLASHHIDLVRFVLGSEIERVGCRLWSYRTEDDNAMLTLMLVSGIVVQTYVSLATVEEDRIEVFGESGKLLYDRYFSERVNQTGRFPREVRTQLLRNRIGSFLPGKGFTEKLRAPLREPSFPRALGRFVEAVRRGESLSPTIEDGWRSLQVVLAAEKANRESRVIEVPS
jgi:myo-inositol 2-dehydrogenase/D-chiro-inositol 1-dehydrogenase